MPRLSLLLAAAALLAACSPSQQSARRDSMTRRQKDSALGQSELPGAQGITKAIRASDSVAAQNARIDSAAKEP